MFNLITGNSGFVGKNLLPYLEERGHLNVCITRNELNNFKNEFLEGCDTIIHLAGKAHDLKKVSVPDEYYFANFELTKNLFDAFLKSNASKFIFVSSVKAVADVVNLTLTEEAWPDPQTHYGKSKLMAENYIRSCSLPEGKSYYILRPCMIHGPGNKGNLNLLYNFVKSGIPYPLAGFPNKRSFLSVQNLCFVISELISQSGIGSGTYQISDDEALSTNEVIEILSSSLNKKVRLWRISTALVRFLAVIGDKLNLPLTTERLNKLTENYVVSNVKIKSAINKPMSISTREGLKLTAFSFHNPEE